MAEAATQPTKLNPEEQKAVAEAQAASRALMDRVGTSGVRHTLLTDLVARTEQAGAEVVMVSVPRQFVLTLDGQARETVLVPKGVHKFPGALTDHWYVKAHQVEKYEGTAMSGRPVPILSSTVFANNKGVDKAAVDDITVAAFTLSGLSAADWNALPEADRGQLMMDVFEHRKRMAERAAADRKAKGGDDPGQQQQQPQT